MSTAELRALLVLTGRWIASHGVRRSAVLLTVTFALLGSTFVSVSAFTLSGTQEADRQLGRYQQSTFTNVNPGDLSEDFLSRGESRLGQVISGAHIVITSPQLTPDSYSKAFVKASIPTVSFIEDRSLQKAFPDRYILSSGEWPKSASDVAISSHLAAALGHPQQFPVMSGSATFHVVGVINDSFAKKGDLIIAGPGTWEAIPRPAAARSYQPVQAQVSVYWGASGSPSTVGRVLQSVLPALPQDHGDRTDELATNHVTRDQIASAPVAGFGSDSIVVSYLPLLLVVLLASALVVRQTRADNLANADRLVTLGVRRGATRLSQVTALVSASSAGIAVGVLIGWLVGFALRAGVLPHYANQPLSPFPEVDPTSVAIAAVALLVIGGGTLWPQRSRSAAWLSSAPVRLAAVPFPMIRRCVAVLALIVALTFDRHSESDTVRASYLAIVAVLLVVADVVRVALVLLPRGNARTFVTRRLMTSDRSRQAMAAAVIACCIAVPVCAATQIASQRVSRAAGTYSLVPPHQLWVQSGVGIEGVAEVGKIVSAVPNVGPAIAIRGLSAQERLHNPASDYAHFLFTPGSGNFNSYTLVLTTAHDLARILGKQLPAGAETTLNAGGVLDFTGTTGNQQFVVDSDGGKRRVVPVSLPTLHVQLSSQFSQQYAGVILLSTAEELKLPVGDPTKYIFSDVTVSTIGEAVRASVEAGFDSRFVQYNVRPPPPDIPTSWYIFLSALALGGFAVLMVVIRGQAVRLRGYSSRLLAVGLTPRWLLSVLSIEVAVILGIGLATGVAAGIIGIVIVTDSYLVLSVPVLPVALSCLGTVLAAGLATGSAVRALTAVESPEVN